jgi:aryl-alcohol dehydrogenase-like predicted oxidoreductase
VLASARFDSAQVYYNLLNPSAGETMPPAWRGHDFGDLLATCRAGGIAVMNIRVLAAGVIASEVRHGREIAITDDADLATEEARARAVFARLGERYGSRAQTAIRFALASPDITCVLVGMAEMAHLEEALAAAEMGPLPAEALAELHDLYANNFGLV